MNKELATVTEAFQDVRSQTETFKMERVDLLSIQKKLANDDKKAAEALTMFRNENAQLQDMVDKLKANRQTAPVLGGAGLSSETDQDMVVLEQKIDELEYEKKATQKLLEDWTALARVSTDAIRFLEHN
jgi:hypothetical protein